MLQSLLDIFLHCMLLRQGEWVNPAAWWSCPQQQIDSAVIWAMWWQPRGLGFAKGLNELNVVLWDIHLHQRFEAFNASGSEGSAGNILSNMTLTT